MDIYANAFTSYRENVKKKKKSWIIKEKFTAVKDTNSRDKQQNVRSQIFSVFYGNLFY